jgi:hypothetical protein
MSSSASPTTGDESPNDWFSCVDFENCGFIGVRPNGVSESCPDCRSGLERYSGELWVCDECGTEYIGRGGAESCCQ